MQKYKIFDLFVYCEYNYKSNSMKKLLILFSMALVLCGCQNTAPSSSLTYEGEQIDALKGLISSFTAGDFETYRSYFTDEARIVHNAWFLDEKAGISIDAMLEQHIFNRENVFEEISVNEGIYEIITQENGNQFGHVWIEFTVKGYESEEEVKIPVTLSYGMKGNQVDFEWGFYDTSNFPKPKSQ